MGDFSNLTPPRVISAVEQAYDLTLDGTVTGYPSYINRVYGLRTQDGTELVAKFYRPGRWSEQAVEEEIQFLLDCAHLDLPVVPVLPLDAPLEFLPGKQDTGAWAENADPEDFLAILTLDAEEEILFSLYPKRSGRSFDTDREEDWLRIGGLVGRMHRASSIRQAQHRLICTPPGSTARFIAELEESGGVHPNLAGDFFAIARRMLSRIQPLFEDLPLQRIHGDCHRGNILNRGAEGLLLIDFDDMMVGPAIQDLWMLLPSRLEDCGWEMELILEGYQQWSHLDRRQLELIEPLRFMRMIYYLAWQNRQRQDRGFQENNPAWGSHAFWIKELEDLREQERWL